MPTAVRPAAYRAGMSVPSLRRFIDSARHEVVAVITRPDAVAGRGRKVTRSPGGKLGHAPRLPPVFTPQYRPRPTPPLGARPPGRTPHRAGQRGGGLRGRSPPGGAWGLRPPHNTRLHQKGERSPRALAFLWWSCRESNPVSTPGQLAGSAPTS